MLPPGHLVPGERVALHLGHGVAVKDAVDAAGRCSRTGSSAFPSLPLLIKDESQCTHRVRRNSSIAALTSAGRSSPIQWPQPGRMIVPRNCRRELTKLGDVSLHAPEIS